MTNERTLTYQRSEHNHDVYTTPLGHEVYLSHDGYRRLFLIHEADLQGAREEVRSLGNYYGRSEMLRQVRDRVSPTLLNPEDVYLIDLCRYDEAPSINLQTNALGQELCEACWEAQVVCPSCDGRWRELTSTYGSLEPEMQRCTHCIQADYVYCGECSYYYYNDDGGREDHRHGRCNDVCESPAREFTVKHGDLAVDNDEMITVTIEAGVVSKVGMQSINDKITRWALDEFYYGIPEGMTGTTSNEKYREIAELIPGLWDAIGREWTTKGGNLTRRVSRHFYKNAKVKLGDALMSEIGNIGRDHSQGDNYWVAMTRNLNLSAAKFGHPGSCWWGGYNNSRCALKSNGGFGLRSFYDNDDVSGRAWVMPMTFDPDAPSSRRFRPTFDTMNPDAFMVFNLYGVLEGNGGARVLAEMYGWTYHKVSFEDQGDGNGAMYINNANGYLVAPAGFVDEHEVDVVYVQLDKHADLYDTETAFAVVETNEETNHAAA